jgi:hypothetical protein
MVSSGGAVPGREMVRRGSGRGGGAIWWAGDDGVFSRVVEASCVVRGGRKASWAARAEKPPCAGARLLGRCGSEGDTRKKENPWWARMGRMAGWV